MWGDFAFHCFAWGIHEEDNVLCMTRPWDGVPLCRVQSACYTAEIFMSTDCDCHAQLTRSLESIQDEGGLFIYMLCDGRGAGLYMKTLGLELGRTEGLDTFDAYRRLGIEQDQRKYERVAYVLRHFKVSQVRLLTNNPRKVRGLSNHNIQVERLPIEIPSTPQSRHYLYAKSLKMGHCLSEFKD